MKSIVVGLGIQGNKREKIAGSDVTAIVDPVHPRANYKNVRDVPLDSYDAALVCTPDAPKIEIITYLLSNRKHVLVEKPLFAAKDSELEALMRLSRQNEAVCYTAYNHRFEPHIMRVKKTIDSGVLGKIYFAKMFYGNGTARDVRLSEWRDKGDGVLPDLGSHLLDTMVYLLGRPPGPFQRLSFNAFENRAYDHVLFSSPQTKDGYPMLELEATLLSWRNTFRFDLYAEKGSAHIECLCKWGPSTFTLRKRVLPSGRPTEETETLEMADPTWALEYEHFKKLCKDPSSVSVEGLETDLWINSTLKKLGGAA